MDSLTQATLGAAVGHLCWHQKIGNRALLLGAVGGTIPDLDIILYPLLDDIQRLYWHRGESHSIFFILFGSLLSAWLLNRFYKRGCISFPLAFTGALLIYATHILIDYFTVYGTQLLAPVSRHGFAQGNFFIIDPLFTVPLLLGCVVAWLSKSVVALRANFTGLAIVFCYTLWSLTVQHMAHATFQDAVALEDETILRSRTTAGPFTTFLWRHVAQTEDSFLVGYWSIFDDPDSQVQFYRIPRRADLMASMKDSDAYAVLQWFSQGWWFAMEREGGRVQLVDLRFGAIPSAAGQSYREWGWPFSWRFDSAGTKERTLNSVVPEVHSPKNTLGLLATRIAGSENWYPDDNQMRSLSLAGDN